MFRVLIVADGDGRVGALSLGLAEKGFLCSIASSDDGRLKDVGTLSVDLVVIAVDGAAPGSEMRSLPQRLKEKTRLPVITLLSNESLDVLDSAVDVDDFVMEPWNAEEVVARVRRILQLKPGEVNNDRMSCGEVAIELVKCEGGFRGRLVEVTFKEY